MEGYEMIEYEYTETICEVGDPVIDIAVQVAAVTLGVLIGNGLCWGAQKLYETINEKATTITKEPKAVKAE